MSVHSEGESCSDLAFECLLSMTLLPGKLPRSKEMTYDVKASPFMKPTGARPPPPPGQAPSPGQPTFKRAAYARVDTHGQLEVDAAADVQLELARQRAFDEFDADAGGSLRTSTQPTLNHTRVRASA